MSNHVFVSLDATSSTQEPPQEFDFAIRIRANGTIELSHDNCQLDCDLLKLPDGSYSARVQGHVFDFVLEGKAPNYRIVSRSRRFSVHAESARERSQRASSKGADQLQEKSLTAPMPGRVAKVCVQAGDVVHAGQSLIVIEAMKMENELRAKAAGTVQQIHVTPGATIEANATLITFA